MFEQCVDNKTQRISFNAISCPRFISPSRNCRIKTVSQYHSLCVCACASFMVCAPDILKTLDHKGDSHDLFILLDGVLLPKVNADIWAGVLF